MKTWIDGIVDGELKMFKLTKLRNIPQRHDPYVKIMSLVIQPSGYYSLYVLGRKTTQATLEKLQLPLVLNEANLQDFVSRISSLRLCHGNVDAKHLQLMAARKGQIIRKGNVVAFFDKSLEGGIEMDNSYPTTSTVHHAECELVIASNQLKPRCSQCHKYRRSLKVLCSRKALTSK